MDIALIISVGILLGCIISLSWFAGSDAPYIPTKEEDLEKLFKLIKIKQGQVFYELGSGDGRVIFEAARLGADSHGVEQSLLRILYSKYIAKKLASHLRGGNINFYHNNIFNRSYEDADIVYIYLLQKAVDRLEGKLRKELKKGSLVITQKYHFKNWKCTREYLDFKIYKTSKHA